MQKSHLFTHAIVRLPGPDFADGLTTSSLGAPGFELMLEQHAAYVAALHSLGLEIITLDALPGYPDAHFVEDVAVVTPSVAVLTNPGAQPRRGEVESMAPVLASHRKIARIQAPGTVDGGDVLMVGSHFFIGVSQRTNQEGCAQLGSILEDHGYSWIAVPVEDGLHLKSSVNHVGNDTLLVTEEFEGRAAFAGYTTLVLSDGEEYAGNTLLINETLITPAGFSDTKNKLMALGKDILELEMSEAQKMDGGLTCLSLRF